MQSPPFPRYLVPPRKEHVLSIRKIRTQTVSYIYLKRETEMRKVKRVI
jgi:hypothetical protein